MVGRTDDCLDDFGSGAEGVSVKNDVGVLQASDRFGLGAKAGELATTFRVSSRGIQRARVATSVATLADKKAAAMTKSAVIIQKCF